MVRKLQKRKEKGKSHSSCLRGAERDYRFRFRGKARRKRSHVWEIGYQVKKEYRSRGVGSLLVKRLIEFLRKRGAKQLIAWVVETNEASINLLRKFNFEKVGKIRKGVRLSNRYCDYLLFQKEL